MSWVSPDGGSGGWRHGAFAPAWTWPRPTGGSSGQLLTASGEVLWWELNGDPVLPIRPQRIPHKILSRGGSFGEPTDVPTVLWAWLVRNLERLVEELVYHRVLAGRVAVWVGYRDGRAGEGRATLETAERPLRPAAGHLPALLAAGMDTARAGGGCTCSPRTCGPSPRQLGLFDNAEVAEAAMALKQAVNQKHGRFSLRSGATFPWPRSMRRREQLRYMRCSWKDRFLREQRMWPATASMMPSGWPSPTPGRFQPGGHEEVEYAISRAEADSLGHDDADPPGVPVLAGRLTADAYPSRSTIRFTFSTPRLATSGFMASRASSRSPSPVGTTFGGAR